MTPPLPSTQPTTPAETILLVLGMHRSGTSAITRAMDLLGINLGDDLYPPGFDNPKGFWEDRQCLAINEELLRQLGSAYDALQIDWRLADTSPAVSSLKTSATTLLTERLRQYRGLWGFKDPRCCRLLPFWNEVLADVGCRTCCVIVLRNPLSVASSLAKRNGFSTEKSLMLWLQHMVPALLETTGHRRVVVDFDRFTDAFTAQLLRIAAALGLPAPAGDAREVVAYGNDFLQNTLVHSRFSLAELRADRRVAADVALLYRVLLDLAEDLADPADPDILAAVADIQRRLPVCSPLNAAADRLEQQRAELLAELFQARALIDRLHGEQQSRAAVAEQLSRELEELRSSRWWRLTRPLRFFLARLGKADRRAPDTRAEQPADEPAAPTGEAITAAQLAVIDREKPTVLIVSHEHSRSGAPILSYNIGLHLKNRYNLVAIALRDGPMTPAFIALFDLVLEPGPRWQEPEALLPVIAALLDQAPIAFAVVNSIAARLVLPALHQAGVPTLCLVHEFCAYMNPKAGICDAVMLADRVIFSSQTVYRDNLNRCPELGRSPALIIPQGRCRLPAGGEAGTAAFPPAGISAETVVILGAGHVQYRKGVDLFIATAAQVLQRRPRQPCHFIWVGAGYAPEVDFAYSAYLEDQLARAGLTGVVSFTGELAELAPAYRRADIFFISSRLDPLPNVAIEAMHHGLPLVCFDRAGGIAETLADLDLTGQCVAAYLDVAHAGQLLQQLIDDAALRQEIGGRLQHAAGQRFSMAAYVDELERQAHLARAEANQPPVR